ncbi:MAG: hypothetical protein ACK5JP_07935 [Akkermansiaceae bacterium]|jgi:endonuclease YncB( thermonuclease family)
MLKTTITALLSLLAGLCLADEIKSMVASVADGDTINVLDATNTQHKTDFEEISAPEKSPDYATKATDVIKAADSSECYFL